MNKKTNLSKIMITGMPACGKSVLIKLLDGHPNIYAVHTHDKILSGLYGFNDQEVKHISDKTHGDISAYSKGEFSRLTMHYKSKDLKLKLSPFLIRHLLNKYTSYCRTTFWWLLFF